MAIVKTSYIDRSGNSYDSSYWRANKIYTNSDTRIIDLVFVGYKDQQAFAEGFEPIPGATKHYVVSGQEFLDVALSKPAGDIIHDVMANAAETYAINKRDTPSNALDANGNPVMVSFFDGATRI